MDITEHNSVAPLLTLLDKIALAANEAWILAIVRKEYLKPVTNEAFLMAVRSCFKNAGTVHIFWGSEKKVYIAWNGEQKNTYKLLRSAVGSALIKPGVTIESSSLISYVDLPAQSEQLRTELKAEVKKTGVAATANTADLRGWHDEDKNNELTRGSTNQLSITAEEFQNFNENKMQRIYRKQMQILVVEDQLFSQKLLCEIIRSVKPAERDAIAIDAVTGIQDGWKQFIKKAHDIAFLDLVVVDGSGHTLAQAIKELDATTCVIIVTANNYEEELGVAQQNNVDGFITKPYNKKQILDYITHYSAGLKARTKGTGHGSADRF
jgi:CheY-like chemotaxis protein